MGNTVGYMITWTTYGTWLQGDKRGYVKDGQILPANQKLYSANINQQKFQHITLDQNQKNIAYNAILTEAKRVNHKILALAVCSNHVHLVAEVNKEPIDQFARRYKVAATSALRHYYPDKIWSKGYDKRFCFSQSELMNRIRYVQQHNIKTLIKETNPLINQGNGTNPLMNQGNVTNPLMNQGAK